MTIASTSNGAWAQLSAALRAAEQRELKPTRGLRSTSSPRCLSATTTCTQKGNYMVIDELINLTKLFAKTLRAPLSAHVEKHGLVIVRNDLLIAHDPHTGRIVITFEVEQALPVRQAAE